MGLYKYKMPYMGKCRRYMRKADEWEYGNKNRGGQVVEKTSAELMVEQIRDDRLERLGYGYVVLLSVACLSICVYALYVGKTFNDILPFLFTGVILGLVVSIKIHAYKNSHKLNVDKIDEVENDTEEIEDRYNDDDRY